MTIVSKNEYLWRFFEGRVYDFEDLKLPFVVPVIESLNYAAHKPVAIDVGGGNCSIVHSARLPRPRYFKTATVDIAARLHGYEPINPTIKANVADIVTGTDDTALKSLHDFLLDATEPGKPVGADLIVYSEILNYIDFRNVMHWFDQLLKPGGYTVIANLATRGWPNLFSDNGVKSHEELLDFVRNDLGHEIVAQEYPWNATDDYEGFMVLATQKPGVKSHEHEDHDNAYA